MKTNTIITSQVDGVELDPDSLADKPLDVAKAIRDLDQLIAANEFVQPAVSQVKLQPTVLCFSHANDRRRYYFKCNVLSIDVTSSNREITFDASQERLLKLFAYWQKSIPPEKDENTPKSGYLKILRKRYEQQYRVPKVRLNKVYMHLKGIKQDLLKIDAPCPVLEMHYLYASGKASLKILI